MAISSANYVPALVERGRVINVNIQDWTVDCVSEYANKRFLDIQMMAPYFHYMNGEGIYAMPEVGAMCWICKPSDGSFSQAFLLGFGAPHDDDNINYRCGRQSLNPGDIMLRTRDENFIVLRRGGVIQIGATPLTQRMYIPIKNIIHDFCENYQLDTLGGTLEWVAERTDQTTDGAAPTKFWLKAKMTANEPQYVAELIVGTQGKDDPRVLELIVRDSGAKDAKLMVNLQITKEGDVLWNVKKNWELVVEENYSLTTSKGDISMDSAKKFMAKSESDMSLETQTNMTQAAQVNWDATAGAVATVDAPLVKLGGNAIEPAILGQQLVNLLAQMITQISTIQQTLPPAPTTASQISALAASLSTIVSTKVFVE